MIKNLIFDFGDVFINLDKKGALDRALNLFGTDMLSDEIHAINALYEQGLMSTDEFLEFYLDNFPNLDRDEIIGTWNYILRDFPNHRLEYVQQLAADKKYKLILLSNTNEMHINWIKENIGFYEEFRANFDAFYLSHEIQLRKPNANIYEFVLKENNMNAEESLFIDDTEENILSAAKLGIHTWHINPETEDITTLFSAKSELF
ncbi:putative hydrolase of the HAD superfamily [Gelidibacter algens]|jgi:putative hydrolase of the HAD superfamily|uniref:Putative hydrolase of the HAD superfamily n=1 Tax=Gelidibacter algens TaxID=49280 RepID=A0A1A7R456_9FLAO|nr:HAD family phosphatase [Gelidibacter algens]OBX26249.1 haloacid dehalogenase [Gelidibacter algens]RAJ24870.1 putative hydrolase of the HAD superfamily [Gelidibacter algens]